MIKTFDEAVNCMNDIPRFTAQHESAVTVGFLDEFGSPDCNPKTKIIHVAGTNGKGSVCCYVTSILRSMGYSVGTFTSPHLVDIRERIMLDGEMIPKDKFVEYTNRVLHLVSGDPERFPQPTYFEFLLLIAMQWYGEKAPDYLVLEVGLGGRFDATNAIRKKAVSVITRIGMDHMQYLGNTIPEIAGEKAGIMMEGVPSVCLSDPADACDRISQIAGEIGSPLEIVDKSGILAAPTGRGIDFSYRCRYDVYGSLCTKARLFSPAEYQAENASLAVRTIEVLGLLDETFRSRVTEESLRRGLEQAFWPGRMEEVLPGFYLDGAHNDDGIRAFLETARDVTLKGTRSILLFSAVKDKQYAKELRKIAEACIFQTIVVAPMQGERALSGEELLKAAQEAIMGAGASAQQEDRQAACVGDRENGKHLETKVVLVEDLREALHYVRDLQKNNGCIGFAAGSLYLVGELKEILQDDQF